jgi:hypothetical protein
MEDNEKGRIGYIAEIEAKLEHALKDLAIYRPLAERWEPKASGEMRFDDNLVRITLAFGGKRVTATFNRDSFVSNNIDDLTAAVCETMVRNLVMDQLRSVVEPEVARLSQGAKASAGAGKW